jgi:signal transduction histidine kinase
LILLAGQASRNQVDVSTDLASGLLPVIGDRIQLQQVILNLMINGIEAMAAIAGRDRQLRIRTGSNDSGLVYVAVEDCGVGISEDVMARLFEPFFTTRTQGIGMGLAISRSIIEAHGGRLWADSRSGQGSVFQFTLPKASGPSA